MAKKRDKSLFNGETLKSLRIIAGLSQTGLAREIGVDRMAVYYWEHPDHITVPSDVNLSKLSKRLNCKINDLFGEFDFEFRGGATDTIQAMFYRFAESKKPSESRLAVSIYLGLFPTPLQHDVNLDISKAEEQVNELLDEGDVPDYKKQG